MKIEGPSSSTPNDESNVESVVHSNPEEVVLASRGRRLAARLVDFLIIAVVIFFVSFVLVRSGLGMERHERPSVVGEREIAGFTFQRREVRWIETVWSLETVSDAVGALLFISAFALFNFRLLALRGQTIGKAMLGIKIVDYDTHAKPSLRVLLGYREGGIFLLGFVFGYLGTALALLNVLWIFVAGKRCGHDYWSHTKVVRVHTPDATKGTRLAEKR